ncbi:hypothetical protein ARC78_11315 [Stenotrophomonas pictorum JCM 9942]|uniref:Classical arabinogalactan protein 4 n=1 Tax=Stenotrophomonas pictorum JCM 9942 TaxID=1236960 RepID=A0A0R0AKV9_9GAMM|nr:hypothetical protein [Stenotrophomonas pictorum]KRG41336.1 hypothetical protein ARC78_11315 [Stenotrophomonas pictorum JCM 9942]
MTRFARIVLLLAGGLPLAAQAQLKPAPSPTATRAVSLPPPSRPQADDNRPAAENAPVRERLQQRVSPAKPAVPTRPAAPAVARPVYDRNGQPLNGMQPAGPNRVIDTRTGRYYDTVPSGTGERVVPPPSAARGN